MAKMLH